MDHSSCPTKKFACGCIIGCPTKRNITTCSIHENYCIERDRSFDGTFNLIQFPCGCLVNETPSSFDSTFRWIDMLCHDHYTSYINDTKTIDDLYINRADDLTFDSYHFTTCDHKNKTRDESSKWVWNENLQRAIHEKTDQSQIRICIII